MGPVSERTQDPVPEGDLRNPVEVRWFQDHAARHGCCWRQIALGPSFGVARTGAGELYVWGTWLRTRKDFTKVLVWVEPTRLILEESEDAVSVMCSARRLRYGLSLLGVT